MGKFTFMIVSIVVIALALVGLYFYGSTFDIKESKPPEMPPIPSTASDFKPDFNFDKASPKPIKVPSATTIETFLNKAVPSTGYPIHVERVVFINSENADDKIQEIVHGTVLQNLHGRAFKSFIVFDRHCEASEPCAAQRQITDPGQLGWSEEVIRDYQSRVEGVIRKIGVTDSDRLFQVNWVTDDGGRFYTVFVTDQNNAVKFEPIIWFSTTQKNCSERQTQRGPQETNLSWDGKAINGFGIEIVSWSGNVTYRFGNGKFLTKEFCANQCLSYKSEFLWEVDSDETKVNTGPLQSGPPEETILRYQVVWSLWFPTKVNAGENVGVEMPPPKGNMVAGSFAIRADGTFNKN